MMDEVSRQRTICNTYGEMMEALFNSQVVAIKYLLFSLHFFFMGLRIERYKRVLITTKCVLKNDSI